MHQKTPHSSPPPRRARRLAANATVLALGLAVLSPLTANAADQPERTRQSADRAFHLPDATVETNSAAAASRTSNAPKVKGWGKPRQVFANSSGFQSYAVDRNGKGQGLVAWSEANSGRVRVWFARITPKNKVGKRQRLTGWIKQPTKGGITGQVATTIDKRGNAVVAWTAYTGKRTGVRAAKIGRKGKVTKRWVTKKGAEPAGIQAHGSPNGHTVIWWNGIDANRYGHPRHFVNYRGTGKWRVVPYNFKNGWEPDEGGSASVNNKGLVTATWVERGSTGRLRAITYNRKGRTTDRTVATASNNIMNSSHTTTIKGQVTVSFMDSTWVNGTSPSTWYTVRRTNGKWGNKQVVPKSRKYGYTWSIDGNNKGKVAMIGLGYSGRQGSPDFVTTTAGIQNRAGGKWTVSSVAPRTANQLNLFGQQVHVTASGRTVTSYEGKNRNGVSWNRKGSNGKWNRSLVNDAGTFLFASDNKSRVTMLAPSYHPRPRLVFWTKKF